MLGAFRNVLVISAALLSVGCTQTGQGVTSFGPSRLELSDKCATAVQKRLDPSPNKPKASAWVVSQDDPRASGSDFVMKFNIQNTTGLMGVHPAEVLCVVRGGEIYDIQPLAPRQ